MEEIWKTIHFGDFVKKLPQIRPPLVYEVNSEGRIRFFNPLGEKLQYSEAVIEERMGVKYFSTLLGHAQGCAIRTTIPVDNIVKKYF